jgi:hypothetical protein
MTFSTTFNNGKFLFSVEKIGEEIMLKEMEINFQDFENKLDVHVSPVI